MKYIKRVTLSLLLLLSIAMLFCESEDIGILLITKAIAVICVLLILFLWKQWHMDDDAFVRKLLEADE